MSDSITKFRELLEKCPLTDQEVADAGGTSYNTANRWRRGMSEPELGQARRVCEAIHRRLRGALDLLVEVESHHAELRRMRGPESDWPDQGDPRDRREPADEDYLPVEISNGGPGVEVSAGKFEGVAELESVPEIVVYLLYRDGELVYVGRSSDIYARLGSHKRQGKDFDEWAYLKVGTKREAISLERAMIRRLDPEYNEQGGPVEVDA